LAVAGHQLSTSDVKWEETMAEPPGAHSLREVEMNTDDRYGFRREFRKQK